MRSLTPYNVLASTNYHNQILIVMRMARNGVDIRHPLPPGNVHTSLCSSQLARIFLSWYAIISLNCFSPCCVIYTSFFQWGHHSKDYLFKPRLTLWESGLGSFLLNSTKIDLYMLFIPRSSLPSIWRYHPQGRSWVYLEIPQTLGSSNS